MIQVLARPTATRTFGFFAYATVLVAVFAAAAAPSPLLVGLQQKWGFSTSLLTVAFAVYALALLVTLLVTGSLSDHLGRRPVLVTALGCQVIVAILFVGAQDIWVIVIARALQGMATGAASGSLTAAVADTTPQRHRRLGSIVGGAAPLVGLAAGGFGAGIAEQYLTNPTAVVFVTLLVTFAAGLIVVACLPDYSARRPGARRSLVPRLSVPPDARPAFVGGLRTAVATWSLGGLYLGLGPIPLS